MSPSQSSISRTLTTLEPLPRQRIPVQTFDVDQNSDHVLQQSTQADSTVPDGGYGWAVVFGCSIISFFFGGTTYSWGVVQAALARDHLSSPSTLAFIGSLTVALIAGLALLNARLVRTLGARITGMLGMFLLGLGEVLSGFATKSVGGLFATQGIVMGIGVRYSSTTASVTPAQWFKSRRGLANGIVYAGSGLGGTAISFALDGLIRRLGIAWMFRVIGLFMMVIGLPGAYLVKDREPLKPAAWVEWRLFKDFRFTTLFLTGAVATFPLFVPVFFLPLYSASLGLSSLAGAGLVAAFQFSSFIGRLSGGFVADKAGPLNTLINSLLLNAVSMLVVWPFATSIGPLIVFTALNGVANGGFFATVPTVVGNIFGSARVAVAMGMIVTAWTGGYLLGAPIAGYILDAAGGPQRSISSYRPAIFYAGAMSALAFVLALMTRIKMSRRLKVKA